MGREAYMSFASEARIAHEGDGLKSCCSGG